jgi:ABC-type polysaccharide/polyol phosphate export permease
LPHTLIAISAALTFVLTGCGVYVFRRLEATFADVI